MSKFCVGEDSGQPHRAAAPVWHLKPFCLAQQIEVPRCWLLLTSSPAADGHGAPGASACLSTRSSEHAAPSERPNARTGIQHAQARCAPSVPWAALWAAATCAGSSAANSTPRNGWSVSTSADGEALPILHAP